MKVVVTGGSGHAGRYVVEHLVQHGYDVTSVDVVRPDRYVAPYRLVDIEDIGQCYGSLAGAESVIPLAAIPRPTYHPNEVVFRNNVMALYNVLEACATLAISRVVFASSVTVLGFPFLYRPFAPQYVPI